MNCKRLALLVLALSVACWSTAEAGKYGSGRSSSGSSSFGGRSYSSGSRSSGSSTPKYTSGSTPSTPKYTSGSTPSTPKYTSGSTPSPKPPAATSSSGKYSSGSSSTPAIPPKGKSYSTGGTSNPGSPSTGPPVGRSNSKIDQSGVTAQQKIDSQASFQKQSAPAPAWKDPKTGKERTFTQTEKKQVDHIRSTVSHERYVTYETRVNTFYGGYVGGTVVHYSDPFNPWFTLWLLDRASAEERALWAYNHRREMDEARWRELVRKDAGLEARVRQLEAEKRGVDPTYVPASMRDQPEVMYNKEYVEAAYNPTPAVYEPESTTYDGPGFGTVLKWFLILALVVGIIGFGWWFVFVRET